MNVSALVLATFATLTLLVVVLLRRFTKRYYTSTAIDHFLKPSSGPGSSCNLSKSSAREKMRGLWSEHGDRTRVFALRHLNHLLDQKDAYNALLNNQKDMGDFIDSISPGAGKKAQAALNEYSHRLIDVLDAVRDKRDPTNEANAWHAAGDRVASAYAKSLNVNEQHLAELLRNHDGESLQIWLLHIEGLHAQEAPRVDANLDRLRQMADYMVSNIQCGMATGAYAGN